MKIIALLLALIASASVNAQTPYNRADQNNARVAVSNVSSSSKEEYGRKVYYRSYSVSVASPVQAESKIEFLTFSKGVLEKKKSEKSSTGSGTFVFDVSSSGQINWAVRVIQNGKIIGVAASGEQYQNIAAKP